MIAVYGACGSMGTRYCAILKWLSKPYMALDINSSESELRRARAVATGFIVATPTDTHLDMICSLAPLKKPILCEKPLSKNLDEIEKMRGLVSDGLNLTMTMQYRELNQGSGGTSYYNYFRHGSDGINWDCLQIIGLARGMVELAEDSPVWRCKLNGLWLELSDMDDAYVEFVRRWLRRPGDDINRLIDIHHKVAGFKSAKGH
jgi:hypothetical protein